MSAATAPALPVMSAPALMTADDFVVRYAGQRVELVKGVVQELSVPPQQHRFYCFRLAFALGAFVAQHDLGRISTNDSWVQVGRNPDTVRGGDVCYFSYDRLPRGPVPAGLLAVVPDLVAEVRSPSERWTELLTKVVEYLDAGVRAVVVLDPASASASVNRTDDP